MVRKVCLENSRLRGNTEGKICRGKMSKATDGRTETDSDGKW